MMIGEITLMSHEQPADAGVRISSSAASDPGKLPVNRLSVACGFGRGAKSKLLLERVRSSR